MSSGRSEFSIDDAFELSLEEGGPGPGGTPPRFGALHFERKGRGDAEEEGEKQSRLKYQNLENDEDGAQIPSDPDGAMKLSRDPGRSSTRSSQWSFSTISSSTQRSYRACCRFLVWPQLDTAPSDPEESPGGSGLLPAVVAGPHTHPHWGRTPGEPFSRCL
ncbi:transmembrane protein 134 isoform X4 [Phascolarctos cinereus]|uniref:Transmembrane protein 134 isoform X4 n=1 Tax=Phascolarctos cinereus TaxID=38626 RepID=A0A6P5INR3_PHACI|nr:transmembrane protein 134 isoform X4 [Phascolarctos cinereus]